MIGLSLLNKFNGKKAFIENAEDMFNNLGEAKMQQLFGMDGDF